MQMCSVGRQLWLCLLWCLQGVLVGFGAILPGISGGALCVAFGMYRPIIDTLADLPAGIKKYGLRLLCFLLGCFIGFIVLAGLAAWLLAKSEVLVTCVFIGFIIGTMPELWHDAGANGRNKYSLLAMFAGFALMLAVLWLLTGGTAVTVVPGVGGYFLCGILWGLSFIVPGLSSSTLLLFFGLYQPMLAGIAALNLAVLLPMGAGMALCVLLLARVIQSIYKNHYAVASHTLLGIVAATTVVLLPAWPWNIAAYTAAIIGGAVASYGFTRLGSKIK